jgi:putative transposase
MHTIQSSKGAGWTPLGPAFTKTFLGIIGSVPDPVNFYLSFSLYGYGLVSILYSLMHVLDYILDRLFRFNRYSLVEKAYSVLFHVVGLSLRDVSDRYYVTIASRESVRRWFHRFSRLFSAERRFRNTKAVDETVVKMHGLRAYVWSAVDVDSGEILAVYASRSRNMLIALKFLMIVLDRCLNKPLIIVDRGPWYRWALERLGLKVHVSEIRYKECC